MENTIGNPPDIDEKGRDENGTPVSSKTRLFMQLLVFNRASDPRALAAELETKKISGVLYQGINDPDGVGLLTFHENPDFFVTTLREVLNRPPFVNVSLAHEYTMFGRTYSLGYESDLNDWLLLKPKRTVLNKAWPWAIWYPLRRAGTFERLPAKEKQDILKEHGRIGFSFGKADFAHDIRLACHGLNKDDNDFVIGLVGKDLYPLSALIETMRGTRQTSEFIQTLGPFFIGKAVWQSPL